MNLFERFLDSIDTPGGHICVLVMLMLMGVGMVHIGVAKGEEVLIGTFGALLAVLRGTSSNKQNGNGAHA